MKVLVIVLMTVAMHAAIGMNVFVLVGFALYPGFANTATASGTHTAILLTVIAFRIPRPDELSLSKPE
jgi:Na+/H+ antiporter NhaA